MVNNPTEINLYRVIDSVLIPITMKITAKMVKRPMFPQWDDWGNMVIPLMINPTLKVNNRNKYPAILKPKTYRKRYLD